MSLLAIEGVRVELGGRPVLEDFSLTVGAGELLVLAGPSGSGKSTLLRAIAGLAPLAGGAIRIAGRRVDDLPPGEREVAMMFQSYALFPHLSVGANLAFGLHARGVPRAERERQVAEVAATLGLASQLARLPRELSGGERQRVALGRAMLRHPKVFLMDEPLSNLDAQLRVRARSEILALHRRLGAATIYVTHDQAEALAIADRLGLMEAGRLQQLAQPLEAYRQPASLFVARFLGSPPMNLLEARAVDSRRVQWRDLILDLPAAVPVQENQPVTLGIRPEHLHLEQSRWSPPLPAAPGFAATVESCAPAGDQQHVTVEIGGQQLIVRAEPDLVLARGDSVGVLVDRAQLRAFDPAGGRSLG